MYCELVYNNEKWRGPLKYNTEQMRSLLVQLGLPNIPLPTTLDSPLPIYAGIVLYPSTFDRPTPPAGYLLSHATRVVENNWVKYTFGIVPRDVEAARASLITTLGTRHELYESERLDFNGIMIMADLEARVNVTHAYEKFQSGRYRWVRWRGNNGTVWITSVSQMEELYNAIVGYVENGFAAKEMVEQSIYGANASSIHTLDPVTDFNLEIARLTSAGEADA